MLRNPPLSKLDFVTKTYLDRQPWVVWDTLGIVFPTVGIDNLDDALAPALDVPALTSTDDARVREFIKVVGSVAATKAAGKYLRVSAINADGGLYSAVMDVYQNRRSAQQLLRDIWTVYPEASEERYVAEPVAAVGPALRLLLHLIRQPEFAGGLLRAKSDADKIIPWVAREMSRSANRVFDAPVDASEGAAPWHGGPYADTLAAHEDLHDQLARRASLIAQWAKMTRVDIMKMSAQEVLQASSKFVSKARPVEQGEVVLTFESGWTAQRLLTKKALKDEGETLSHCVGSYCTQVESGVSVIYSVRDPDGVPYVSVEIAGPKMGNGVGLVSQIVGSGNSNIGSNEFSEYVFQKGQANDPPLEEDDVGDVILAISKMVLQLMRSLDVQDASAILQLSMYIAEREDVWDGSFVHAFAYRPGKVTVKDFVDQGDDVQNEWFKNISFERTKTRSISFADADLSDMSFVGADIRDTYFADALLFGADFRVGTISEIGTFLYGAEYDDETLFPSQVVRDGAPWRFDPKFMGMVLAERFTERRG